VDRHSQGLVVLLPLKVGMWHLADNPFGFVAVYIDMGSSLHIVANQNTPIPGGVGNFQGGFGPPTFQDVQLDGSTWYLPGGG
jgi:hypothetical protein